MQPRRAAFFLIIMLLLAACSGAQSQTAPTRSAEPSVNNGAAAAATKTLVEAGTPGATETTMLTKDNLMHLWAETGVLSPFELPGIATGAPDSTPGCGNAQLTIYEDPGDEIYLTLQYDQPLTPTAVNLVMKEMTSGIERVEILNTRTGLGREIFEENPSRTNNPFLGNECTVQITLPVNIDFEVNTVIIGFSDPAAATLLDAVELVGYPVGNEEAQVFWRVPLPGTPVSLTVDALNQVYVSIEMNQLLKFDIEGNLLEELAAPISGKITDMAIDARGNLVLSDGDFGEYVILSPNGEIARGGGDAPTVQVAVGPGQENVYMLADLDGLYYLLSYLPNTFEIINPLPLDGSSYKSLVFNAENQLYTIRDEDGFLVEIDYLSGLEINSIPLKQYNQGGVSPRDLAIDRDGNYHVLFTSSPDKTAVRIYDPSGFFTRSFGLLIDQPQGEWMEGSFYEPKAIALTPDARFALVIDGYGDSNYLTCLLLQSD